MRVSILEDFQKSSGHGLGQSSVGIPVLAGELDQVTSRGPFPISTTL